MKIVCFSDLHAHNFHQFDKVSDETGSHRLDQIIQTLVSIRDFCSSNGISKVIFSGDLFHVRSKVSTIVYNSVYDTVKSFYSHGVDEFIMVVGNHDQADNSDVPEHSLHAFNDLQGVYVYGDLSVHTVMENGKESGVTVVAAPYSKNTERVKSYINSLDQSDIGSSSILAFHLGISGGFVGNGMYPMSEAFSVEDLRPDLFKYVVGGHFHKRQFLGDLPNAFYCGAPIQHDFGDEGEDKGFVLIDTDKRWNVTFVSINNAKFYTYKTVPSESCLIQHSQKGDYLRFQLSEKEVDHLKAIAPESLNYKLELKKDYVEENRVDVKIGMSFSEIIKKYAEEFKPEAVDVGLRILQEIEGGHFENTH